MERLSDLPFHYYDLYEALSKSENKVNANTFEKDGFTLEISGDGTIRKFSHKNFIFFHDSKRKNDVISFEKGSPYDVKYAMQGLVPPRFYSHSTILESADVQIWEFDSAREDLRGLSQHGGDEDYIILMKKSKYDKDYKLELIVDRLTVCDYDQMLVYVDDEEYYLFITSHS